MIKKFLFILFASHFQAISANHLDLSKNNDARSMLNIYDYEIIKTLDFMDYEDLTAYTFLYKNKGDKNAKGFSVTISPAKDGKRLYFSASESCVQGQHNENDVITVEGKNIQATSSCGLNADNALVVGFLIKTDAGKKYVLEQFTKKNLVRIRFRAMIIPFETANFNKAWKISGDAAI